MPHVTSIGLDVHARSVAAAAFNPFTGEVVHRDFGTDAAEIAEWALGFEDPRACYESGPTGFHMARELRALGLDCAVAAVSRMQRPAADARRKNDRRDAEFIARMLATHNIVEVPLPDAAVEAARDLDRALEDAAADYLRARQRLNMFLIRLGYVWDERNADGTRKGSWTRAHWRWISEIRLEGPQRDVLEHYVTARGARSRTAGNSRRRSSPSPGPTGGARPSRRSPASRGSTPLPPSGSPPRPAPSRGSGRRRPSRAGAGSSRRSARAARPSGEAGSPRRATGSPGRR